MASLSLVLILGGSQVKAQSFGVKFLGNTTDNVTGAADVSPTQKDDAPIDRTTLSGSGPDQFRWATVASFSILSFSYENDKSELNTLIMARFPSRVAWLNFLR